MLRPLSVCLALCLFAQQTASHEYWIAPTQPTFEPGTAITANLKVGENFKGGNQIFSPKSYQHFLTIMGGEIIEVTGTLGDRPAGNMPNAAEGLAVMALVTDFSVITYTSYEKFTAFAKAHGADDAIAEHDARGLSRDGIREAYLRFAKSLIRVGEGEGADVQVGMGFELTALDNPYTSEESVRFLLTRKKSPQIDHQVDIFHMPTGADEAIKTSLKSDENGVVVVPLREGQTMVSAVALEVPPDAVARQFEVVWYSLWASSTFWVE